MTAHSRYGGSTASRWLNCPGSVPLSDGVPAKGSSPYAEEGTFAHALAEMALTDSKMTAQGYLHRLIYNPSTDSAKLATQEMIDAVDVYIGEVWDAAIDGTEMYVEERFVLPIPAADEGEVFGSNDCTVFNPGSGKLTVFDYKHGQGVGVSAFENKQLMFYAAGAVYSHPEWDVKAIDLVIVQPRGPFPEPVSRWEMPMWLLIDYLAQINAAVVDSKAKAPTFQAGDWCRWCPAATVCTVREKAFLDAAALDFGSVVDINTRALPKIDTLDKDRMRAILDAFDGLSSWVGQIADLRDVMLMSGDSFPGYKVVEKVARRKWAENEEEIATYLTAFHGLDPEEVRPRKLATITSVEKQLKAKLGKAFGPVKDEMTLNYTIKESSGLCVAPDTDKRPAVAPAEQEFGSVNINSLFDGE